MNKDYLQGQELHSPSMAPLTIPEGVRLPPGKIIVLMKFGSHLYGTDTPESDVDYKGVFMPDQRSVLLGRIPKTDSYSTGDQHGKNKAGDIDVEWFSLHRFLELACEGQTVALDMLHAPREWPEVSSPIWKELRLHAHRFNTKNLKAFLGYCQRQAAKYGVKGSRLAAVNDTIALFESVPDKRARIADVWEVLQCTSHREHVQTLPPDETGRCFLVVCGRKLQNTITIEQALDPLRKFASNYGARAHQSETNEGIDWKAVSHAIRAGYELEELYTHGRIQFPLLASPYLTVVKQGKLDYTTEVAPELERIIDHVNQLAAESNYPEKVNRVWWDDWLEAKMQGIFG